ncbi:hypothetical protein QQF64_006325 [Cirrhinus molitorella]|uniref:Uncharacterized protein n=1 Tax=Cirrhinus molitorella TaxID=172907 RepID=A0ABR3MET6_9TELE
MDLASLFRHGSWSTVSLLSGVHWIYIPRWLHPALPENQEASGELRISGQKSKVVCIGYTNSRYPITIHGQWVEVVIFYLDSIISLDRDAE